MTRVSQPAPAIFARPKLFWRFFWQPSSVAAATWIYSSSSVSASSVSEAWRCPLPTLSFRRLCQRSWRQRPEWAIPESLVFPFSLPCCSYFIRIHRRCRARARLVFICCDSAAAALSTLASPAPLSTTVAPFAPVPPSRHTNGREHTYAERRDLLLAKSPRGPEQVPIQIGHSSTPRGHGLAAGLPRQRRLSSARRWPSPPGGWLTRVDDLCRPPQCAP